LLVWDFEHSQTLPVFEGFWILGRTGLNESYLNALSLVKTMGDIDQFKDSNGEINRDNLKKIIPYEDPFLMIDKVLSLDKKKIVAIKEVRAEEEYFKGHFKDFPIMPGALIVEGLGQAATLLIRYNIKNHEQKDILAYKIRSAKFFRPTFPGQTLRFEAKLVFMFKRIAFVNGIVFRNNKPASKVKMVLAIVDREQFRGRYTKK
jgi:3-hydroxymyristoyl/3-hydroxydecanoyl-(acyl carrier protein) dehydratase